jgi:CheY-like chemotaxis protein
MTAMIAGNRCFLRHPTAAASLVETPSRLRVLVAEDDEPSQLVLRIMLERRGYSVRIVANGRQALAALDEGSFDLLLLDVRMPEVDGWQVVESLRRGEEENPGCGRLPVIALTAMARTSDRERCMQAGMDEYLSKPLRVAELYATLDRVTAGQGRNLNPEFKRRHEPAAAHCSEFCQPDVHLPLVACRTPDLLSLNPL